MPAKARIDSYSTVPFSMDKPTERESLQLLEQTKDPDTIRILESLPLSETARCLEIGPGRGSIAYWLAEKYPQGQVVAVDIDTRNLDRQHFSNLEIQETDILTCEFAASSFDLIYIRALLCHLPAREEVLARVHKWISTGGWL